MENLIRENVKTIMLGIWLNYNIDQFENGMDFNKWFDREFPKQIFVR